MLFILVATALRIMSDSFLTLNSRNKATFWSLNMEKAMQTLFQKNALLS